MSLIRYNPYGLSALQHQLNRLFDEFDRDFLAGSEELSGGVYAPPMDVKEDDEAYIVQLEVPGVPRDKLELTFQDNHLVIRGSREQSSESTASQFRRVERSYGTFARSLSLPHHVDPAGVTANLTDGVLRVRLPKSNDARPRQISISEINSKVHDGKAVESRESAEPERDAT